MPAGIEQLASSHPGEIGPPRGGNYLHAVVARVCLGAAQVGDNLPDFFGGHVDFHNRKRYWDFKSVGRGKINFEPIIRALNDIEYTGPLSVEWEAGAMDREAATALGRRDFAPFAASGSAAKDTVRNLMRARVLRRGERESSDSASFGSLVIDRSAMTVTKNGEDLQLTPTELRLLLELSRRPGQALSRQQLLRLVWEHDYLGDSRLVDACVQRLRAKVEDVP